MRPRVLRSPRRVCAEPSPTRAHPAPNPRPYRPRPLPFPQTLAAGLKSLAALKEEEVEKAAAAATAVKGQTHNGQLWNRPARAVAEAPAVAAEGGSDAVDAPEGPKSALKAKVVKF